MKKRILSLLLCLAMVISLMPMAIFADGVPADAVAYVTVGSDPYDADGEGGDDLGGGYYKTLQAAINACPTDGTEATITMVDDDPVTSTLQVTSQKHITIDLNGHEVFGWFNTAGTSELINNKGYLTLKDSSDTNCNGSGNGKLTSKATKPDLKDIPGYASNVINNEGGHLTIESGYYESLTDQGYASYVVDNNANGCSSYLTVNGGKLYSANTDVIRMACNSGNAEHENIVTINGGIIAEDDPGDRAIWMQYFSGAVKNKAIVNMNGGQIIGGIATYSYAGLSGYFSEDQEKNVEFNIHGGSMDFLKVYTNTGTTCKIDISEKDGINSVPKIGQVSLAKYVGSAEMRKISAGYFNADVSDYVVEGKYCIPNHDTTDAYGVNVSGYKYKIGDEPSTDYVAQVLDVDGNVKQGYPSLKQAVGAALAGETVQLLQDITIDTTVEINKNITLDLANHKLFTYCSTGLKPIENVELTIANGTISDSGSSVSSNMVYPKKGATVNLDGVTINATGSTSYPIYCYDGGVTINAVEGSTNTIKATYYYGIFSYGAVYVTGTGNLNINVPDYGIYICDYDTNEGGMNYAVKIDNPNVNITVHDDYYSDYAVYAKGAVYDSTAVIISGGTYSGDWAVSSTGVCKNTSADFEISGGTFNGHVNFGNPSVPVKITGGTFGKEVYVGTSTALVEVKDGTFNADFYHYDNQGKLKISGGVFNGLAVIFNNEGNAEITGGTFNDGFQIVYNYGSASISDGTFYPNSAIYLDDEPTYDAVNSACQVYDTSTFEITGGTFKGGVTLVDMSPYYMNKWYESAGANGKNISIEGGKFGGSLYEGTNHAEDDVVLLYCDATTGQYSTDGSLNYAKVISGGIFTSDIYEDDYNLFGSYWTNSIDPAYAKALNTDENTMVAYPFTVKPLEIKVNPETIENADKKTIDGQDLPDGAEEKANDALEDTLNNTAVGLFVETGIEEATNTKTVQNVDDTSFNISMVLDAVKEAAKDPEKNLAQKDTDPAVDANAAASGNGQITISEKDITDAMIDKKVNVDLEASKIEVIMDDTDPDQVSMTTVNGATFDVKPTATITITDGSTGEVISKVTAVIPNEAITSDITFRLPVDPQIGANLKITSVWHSDDKENFKKDYLGIFPIQCENGEYFIELSAREFSYYTYENMMNITDTHVAAIRDKNGNYTGFDTLGAAIAAFNAGEGTNDDTHVYNAQAIILLDDIQAGTVYVEGQAAVGTEGEEGYVPAVEEVSEPESFDFGGKTVELDLNGYRFVADPAEGTGVVNATGVTVINSDSDMAKKRLAATGIYANDVSEFIVDGYDVKTTLKNSDGEDFVPAVGEKVVNNEVFNNTDPKVFTIEVETSTTTDHDKTNDETPIHTGNRVDVYADELVTVKVIVNGGRFTAADVTLTWDTSLFQDTTNARKLISGWEKIVKEGKTVGWRFTNPKGNDSYFGAGTVLGEFTFKALYINESKVDGIQNLCTFTVKNDKEYSHDAKVIGSWGITLEDSSTAPVPFENLKDDTALILLMNSMTGAVEGKTNLIYKGTEIDQALLNPKYNNNKGWSAKVGGQEYAGATIKYAVLTPDNAALVGTQKKNESGASLYIQADGSEGTNVTATPAKYKTEDFLKYTDTAPTGKDSGKYTVYYRIKADGYQTVENTVEVTIAKQKVNLEWTAPTGFNGAGDNSSGNYTGTTFNAPTAKFSDLDGGDTYLTADEIVWTAGPNPDKSLKDVGEYTFTAIDQRNYEFNNPTAKVKVIGKQIEGWQLTATNSTTDPKTGVIWRDGNQYATGKLMIDNSIATIKPSGSGYVDENGEEVTNVKIVYEYYDDVDDEWKKLDGDPADNLHEDLGTYKLRITVTADNYEMLQQDVTFQIKNPIFVMENLEYVAGYSIVLVYTDEKGVSFNYGKGDDAIKMYDVSIFGYKYNNNNYGNGTATYKYVYATVVKGAADLSKVYASNDAALELTLPDGYTNYVPSGNGDNGNIYINDVNNKTTASVDLDDVTAVQSIYNVNAGNMLDMELVLRSDVNRDKKVDTTGDTAQVRAFYIALKPVE